MNWKPKIKIFADGATLAEIAELDSNPIVSGFTTNPSLMRKLGVTDYEAFCRSVLDATQKPVSFEVLSDEPLEIRRQAEKIAAWGENVFVKIPVIHADGSDLFPLISDLASDGIKLNVTAILTQTQIRNAIAAVNTRTPSVLSVFAGRIADTGVDPWPWMYDAKQAKKANSELLWASVREPLNIYQAEQCGADIVTVPIPILRKAIAMHHASLRELAKETVAMFVSDAKACGFTV